MKKTTQLFFLIAILLAWGNGVNAQNTECAGTLTESGSEFNYKFETSGTDVIVTFEMVTARTGLVAYAQTYNPTLNGNYFTIVALNGYISDSSNIINFTYMTG